MSTTKELLLLVGVIVGVALFSTVLILFVCFLIQCLSNNENEYTEEEETTNEIFIEKKT
tara:strand:- start:737 stop:913 length:177 start_codon:yes stop_codon:yes gene_type:complete